MQLKKPVLPVILSDKVDINDVPAALAQIQCIDYQAQDKDAYKALRRALADLPLEECTKLMCRVADGERWVFEINPQNRFTLALDTSAGRSVTATGELRDGISGARAKELKVLGWTVKEHGFVKGAAGAAAVYATGGVAALALLSKTVRDLLMSFEATRSWPAPRDKDALAVAAAEFALALQRTAPDVKTIIVRKAQE